MLTPATGPMQGVNEEGGILFGNFLGLRAVYTAGCGNRTYFFLALPAAGPPEDEEVCGGSDFDPAYGIRGIYC